jgi:hypothetical protein
MYTLIQTARFNGVDPDAWLADVLARINDLAEDHFARHSTRATPDLHNSALRPASPKRLLKQVVLFSLESTGALM